MSRRLANSISIKSIIVNPPSRKVNVIIINQKIRSTLFFMADVFELHVYFDDNYFFISRARSGITVDEYCRQLEFEYSLLFTEHVSIFGIQDADHADLPGTATLSHVITDNSAIFPIRSVVTCSPTRLAIQLLTLPHIGQLDAMQPKEHQYKHHNPDRCKPYCQPLAPFGCCNEICTTCGEVKAYLATTGNYCTPFCYSSEVRKQKSQNMDFCSICLGRVRQGKYVKNCMHQCAICHRPWLILNSAGVCRTCHCVITGSSSKLGSKKDRDRSITKELIKRSDKREEKSSFKPNPIVVVGEGAIDPYSLSEVRESRRLSQEIVKGGYGDLSRVAKREALLKLHG
ncbi:Hypothetical protein DHA2_7534 [Giardia duodenalis]|uniref:Uncharacterized protein n=1 Tax=Giardia intestinalis TaxID=5741 RepID=V6TDS1_GIAIN|nr:Hypothetical protein DHA2_7534 [Giardia intestinalis]